MARGLRGWLCLVCLFTLTHAAPCPAQLFAPLDVPAAGGSAVAAEVVKKKNGKPRGNTRVNKVKVKEYRKKLHDIDLDFGCNPQIQREGGRVVSAVMLLSKVTATANCTITVYESRDDKGSKGNYKQKQRWILAKASKVPDRIRRESDKKPRDASWIRMTTAQIEIHERRHVEQLGRLTEMVVLRLFRIANDPNKNKVPILETDAFVQKRLKRLPKLRYTPVAISAPYGKAEQDRACAMIRKTLEPVVRAKVGEILNGWMKVQHARYKKSLAEADANDAVRKAQMP